MTSFHIIHKLPVSPRVNAWIISLIEAQFNYTTEVGGWDQLFANSHGRYLSVRNPSEYIRDATCSRMDG